MLNSAQESGCLKTKTDYNVAVPNKLQKQTVTTSCK